MGFSQQQLAAELGLTFQQVQKYERGLNRISASKLWMTSKFLQVHVSYFFADFTEAGEAGEAPPSTLELISTPEGERLANVFPKLDRRLQRRLVELVEAMQQVE